MPDKQVTLDEMDIRLDAAETLIQRIKKWPGVFVIIVSMGANERRSRPGRLSGRKQQGHQRKDRQSSSHGGRT